MAAMLTPKDRSDLRLRGLTIRQIDEIEVVLPSAKAWLTALSPMKAVREKLTEVIASSEATIKLLRGIQAGLLPAQAEAFARVQVTDAKKHNGTLQTLDGAVEALERLRDVAVCSLDELPKRQRQTNAISPMVLRLIDDAMLRGIVLNGGKGELITPSSTPNGAYSDIACICLRAMGKADPKPEAMIKAHVRWRAARRLHQFQEMESRGGKS